MQNFKLDKIDYKILYELDGNSRMSLSAIARNIQKTPQEVKRRFDILTEQKIIQYFWPMIEYRSIGYFFILYFLKLHNIDEQKEKEFFEYLNSINDIPIIMRSDGYYDAHVYICSKGMFRAEKVFQDINAHLSEYIMSFESVIPIGFSQFRRNYLVNKKTATQNVALTGDDVGDLRLKPITLKTLELLNTDARITTQEISMRLGISYEKAKREITRLENLGVIQSYSYILDHHKIGFPRHRVLFQLRNLTPMQEQKFYDYCNRHPNIIHYIRVLGGWQLMLDIEVESKEKLRNILRDMKLNFAHLVYRIESTEIYHIDRFRDIPLRLIY